MDTLLINEKEKLGIVITYYFAWVFSIRNGFWTEMKEIRSKEVENLYSTSLSSFYIFQV